MSEFIHDVGGLWEFIKGIFYIVVIIGSIVLMVGIIRDIRLNDGEHDYD